VLAQILEAEAGQVDALVREAERAFAEYRAEGARQAGVLVTLDAANSFPRHPMRTDGPFLVWLGILPDDETFKRRFGPVVERCTRALAATGLLRGVPELVVLEPTPRSRLRWLPAGCE